MPGELIIIAAVVAVCLFILHIKSHIKFILLGLYIGVVLADTVAVSIYNYISPRLSIVTKPGGYNALQLGLLIVPTLLIGFNHVADKKKWGLTKQLVFVVITSILLFAAILRYLPADIRQSVLASSMIAFQINQLFIPLLVVGAVLLIIESFHHKKDSKISV